MSVRERIFFATDREPAALADEIAAILPAELTVHPEKVEVVIPTAELKPGVEGKFGGPLLRRDPEWPFRPPDEWEAMDAYDREWRLWQAYGPSVDTETGEDLELTAASTLFERLATALRIPMLHVHLSDQLVAAFDPGHGLQRYPKHTTIYDWDEETWGPYVLPSPSKARES